MEMKICCKAMAEAIHDKTVEICYGICLVDGPRAYLYIKGFGEIIACPRCETKFKEFTVGVE